MRTAGILSALAVCATQLADFAVADNSDTSYYLVNKKYQYPDVPEYVDNGAWGRGPQTGYNVCNSTTEGQSSMCQTSWVNSIEDFCLWAPPDMSTIADEEATVVAWCTKPKHGARLIPENTITGLQYLKAPSFRQITGVINQVNLNLKEGDTGGELDPHGADNRGNPLGGIMFSTAFPNASSASTVNGTKVAQVIQWNQFIGGNVFCIKVCDPDDDDAAQFCNNKLDLLGCQYNAPGLYEPSVFEYCEADNGLPPGVYSSGGQRHTYTQPQNADENAFPDVPYTASAPNSSRCATYESTDLFVNTVKGQSVSGQSSGTPSDVAVSTTGSSLASVAKGTPTDAMVTSTRGASSSSSGSGSGSGSGGSGASSPTSGSATSTNVISSNGGLYTSTYGAPDPGSPGRDDSGAFSAAVPHCLVALFALSLAISVYI